jgi:hypothetical protein
MKVVVVVVAAAAAKVPGVADVSVNLGFEFGSGLASSSSIPATVIASVATEPGGVSALMVGLAVPGRMRVVADGLVLVQGRLWKLRGRSSRWSEWGRGEKAWLLKLLRGLSGEA